jgi:hypothetical protein
MRYNLKELKNGFLGGLDDIAFPEDDIPVI